MTDFDLAHQTIVDLVNRFEKGITHYTSPAYQESEARQDFIDDFFTALGWDVRHREQQNPYEQEVKIEKSQKQQEAKAQKRADYAFYLAPNFKDEKFFAEAKKPSIGLKNSDHYFQTIRYGWSANVPVSILTDFEEFHILDCRIKPDIHYIFNGQNKEYRYTDYLDKEKFAEIYWIFSREAVANGSLEKYAASLAERKTAQKTFIKGGYKPIDEDFLEYIDAIREDLAKAFKKNDETLTGEELTEAVQRTIDRLVFIRFLEDKLIEPENHVSKWTSWKDFAGDCRKLDAKYNGIVFKKHFIDNQYFAGAEEKLFKDICSDISNLNSPYQFNYLPIHILGSIYERFLGKIVVTTAKRVHIEEKPEVRKAGGVYYTPKYIVDYIAGHTIGKLIEEKTPKEIVGMHFADIACGSGSFLIGVYDLLLEYHTKYYNEKLTDKTNIDKRSEDFGNTEYKDGQWRLTLKLKQDILLNNIFGVDIDAQAVEVTQLSLFLKMLEDESLSTTQIRQGTMFSKVLPDLSKNIVCGNSLIGTDILTGQLFSFEEEKKLNPMDFEMAFPEVMRGGGFDAIVGNPPYVRQETLGDQKNYFQKKYSVYHGMADLYTYFFERGIKLLKPTGLFSIIVGNKWMRARYGEPLRKWLKEQRICEIIDFGDLPVFKGATTYTCIPTITQHTDKSKDSMYSFDVVNVSELEPDLFNDYVLENKKQLSIQNLDDSAWSLGSEKEKFLLSSLFLKGVPLKKYVKEKIYRGIVTGCNEAFIIDETIKKQLTEQDPKSAEIIKPFLVGKDIKRYQKPYSNKYVLFTKRGININAYPAVKKYLLNFKERLLPKPSDWNGTEWKGRKPGAYKWYEIQDTIDYYKEFEESKILWPGISSEVSAFAVDTEKYYGNDNTQLIISNDKYLLGVINSKISKFILRQTCDKVQGGFYRLKIIYVEKLPIKIPSSAKEKELQNQISLFVDQILYAKEHLKTAKTDRDKTFLESKCTSLDKQIDNVVYQLYELTSEEIGIIENG